VVIGIEVVVVPPPVERHRLVVATAIAMDDSDNHRQDSRLSPTEISGLVLEQYINTDHFAPSLVVPSDRPVSCFPLGRGWDLDDLAYHRSSEDDDGVVDPVYPRYREMFQMIRDNDVLNINEDEDSEEEKEDVLLLLPASTAASSSADQEQHAMGSDDDDQAVSCTDDRPGGLIEPDDWLYRDETIIRSINACFHVMEVPTRERPHTIQKCRVTKMWRPWKF
jgi:hypothetical protein